MKTLTITILALIVLAGCRNPEVRLTSTGVITTVNKEPIADYTNRVQIVLIDSCEYILSDGWREANTLTHKANCKNSFHKK